MNKLNDWPYGCYIDGSHWNDRDFTVAVIQFASGQLGFEYDSITLDYDLQRLKSEECDIEEEWDIDNGIEWLYLQAMDYLNDKCTDGNAFWFVENSSLYYDSVDDEEV